MNWAAQHADAPLGTHLWVVASIFMASVAIAYASVKVYDCLLYTSDSADDDGYV